MTLRNQEPSATPPLKRLQTEQQNSIRAFFRLMGPFIFLVGVICVIGGLASFFSSFGSFEAPHYFWLCFIGMPLMFVGGILSNLGFMGAVARYIAGESAPVAVDTVNYVADETKGAIETVAQSAAKGVVEGIGEGRAVGQKSFCPQCGKSVENEFKFCPQCGNSLAKA